MADNYLLKVGIDLDQAQLDKITGTISDELVSMGKISDDFINKALETAKKYNQEIEKQKRIIQEIDEKLKGGNVDPQTKQLLEQTKKKAQDTINDYTYGNEEKGLESKAVVDSLADYASQMESTSSKIGKAMTSATSKVGKFTAGVSVAATVIKEMANTVKDAIDQFSNYANQLSPMSAFGSQSQRNLMSRYGMSSTQALGFRNVLDEMGMSENDIGKMTNDQRRVFNELTNFWNEGMGKLDPDKLARYNKTMEEYQTIQAKFHMGLQMTVMKLISESPKFEKFIGKIGDFMDETLDFLGSPLVQAVFDGLIDFLNSVMTILEKMMRLLSTISGGKGFGSGDTITNNNSQVSNNSTFNIYGTDFRSNDELARQLSYSSKGGYNG